LVSRNSGKDVSWTKNCDSPVQGGTVRQFDAELALSTQLPSNQRLYRLALFFAGFFAAFLGGGGLRAAAFLATGFAFAGAGFAGAAFFAAAFFAAGCLLGLTAA